ncbi:Crinkler (CRN) [Phytophthora megakarya]|uniref:Crinkler (CRN) n=1 Tax=Phytophthora megakarya TaxID=4795 RepID=A0A225VDQ8_9STRA|nr:Crinkler (CRN) [Phytophthora megakarya]
MKLFCVFVGEEYPFEVEIDNGGSVYALKAAIKKMNSDDLALKNIAAKDLHLFLATSADLPGEQDGSWLTEKAATTVKIDESNTTPVLIDEHGNRQGFLKMEATLLRKDTKYLGVNFQPGGDEVHVLVVLPCQRQVGSRTKQMRYKKLSTEVSCVKFLDALARKLSELYDFAIKDEFTTISDVFRGIDNGTWTFRSANGKQFTTVELPEFFDKSKWESLRGFNERTMSCIHDGVLRRDSKGRP